MSGYTKVKNDKSVMDIMNEALYMYCENKYIIVKVLAILILQSVFVNAHNKLIILYVVCFSMKQLFIRVLIH